MPRRYKGVVTNYGEEGSYKMEGGRQVKVYPYKMCVCVCGGGGQKTL